MIIIQFSPIDNSSMVCICHIPQSTRVVFFPVLDSIIIKITRIFSACWVGLAYIHQSISIDVFITIIELVAISIV